MECNCGGCYQPIDTYKTFAVLWYCENCGKSKIEFKKCAHQYETFKINYGNENWHIVTKCTLCGDHYKTHKKKDFNIDDLQIFDKEIVNRHHQEITNAREKFASTLNNLKLEWKIKTNQWSIEKWYEGYLSSSIWLRKRNWVLKRSGGKCEKCGEKAIHVHHKTYERVGYEEPDDLMAVCKSCHGKEHSENPELSVIEKFRVLQ